MGCLVCRIPMIPALEPAWCVQSSLCSYLHLISACCTDMRPAYPASFPKGINMQNRSEMNCLVRRAHAAMDISTKASTHFGAWLPFQHPTCSSNRDLCRLDSASQSSSFQHSFCHHSWYSDTTKFSALHRAVESALRSSVCRLAANMRCVPAPSLSLCMRMAVAHSGFTVCFDKMHICKVSESQVANFLSSAYDS